MKLREFFAYRKECPVCQSPLVTSFHSQKKQKTRYEDDRYLVLFDLKSLNRSQSNYKVGYSFGLDDNSLQIEFYDTWGDIRLQNEVPSFLLKRFKALDANLGEYKIYKHCTNCKRYNYSTGNFTLDYKGCSIGEVSVHTEYVVMVAPTNDDAYKVYKMLNYYNSKETWLSYGKVKTHDIIMAPYPDAAVMDLPNMIRTETIPFVSHDETMQRVSRLITFS